jgi:hypothetical protein
MPFPTIATPSVDYERPSTFTDLFIRPAGEKYQTLGDLSDCELQITNFGKNNSRGMNRSNGASGFTAKCRMKQCALTEQELLYTLRNGTNAFLFKMADAGAIPTSPAVTEGWILVSASQVGVHATVDLSGDPESDGSILLEFAGSIPNSAYAAAVKASIDDGDFESSSDNGTYHGIGIYTATKDGGLPNVDHNLSCGVASVTYAYTGGAAQTLGDITDVKITFEFKSGKGNTRKMNRANKVGISIEFDGMETNAANLINVPNMVNSEIDAVVTMFNGLVYTLTNKVGIQTTLNSTGDMDQTRMLHFISKGNILPSQFNGIVS